MTKAERFFYDNAGISYHPSTETMEQGRQRTARELASAEAEARDEGISFDWDHDPDMDSSTFFSGELVWPLWVCRMYNADGEIIGYIGGVDFGIDGSPWNNAYKRVVEAELALDVVVSRQ